MNGKVDVASLPFDLIFIVLIVVVGLGVLTLLVRMFRKVDQGTALIRTGMGGGKVGFSGMFVFPVLHRFQLMDISLKKVVIERSGKDGLVCSDNIRADIKVAFFVRVNKTVDDVLKVAQAIGCERASEKDSLVELFDPKFSEALKTVGKRFDFTELYTEREKFKSDILQVIGTDLNGYIMDDAAIDYLEQTPLKSLDPDHILDSQGISKITEITAQQHIKTNKLERDREKTITQQNVEAKEAVLELNRQLAEAEDKQKREVQTVRAREEAETEKVRHEESLKVEMARIQKEEEMLIAEENKDRQVIVATKNKERTEAVETERVDKDRLLELNEKERIVDLAKIEKEKALEEERRNIQDVIRERVIVEKLVVEEEEKIKTTILIAEADREKGAALINAEKVGEEAKILEVIQAESSKESSKLAAEQQVIGAEADQKSAEKKAEAIRILADARIIDEATPGLSEARIMGAKADARRKEGEVEAEIMERKAQAQAEQIRVSAEAEVKALQQRGETEALILERKAIAEAKGVEVNAIAAARGVEVNAAAEAKGVELHAAAKAKGVELNAAANEKSGLAEAVVLEQKAVAEAKGVEASAIASEKSGLSEAVVLEQKAVAEAKGVEANATATEKMGEAEALVMTKKNEAEAFGIEQKAEAMKKMDGVGRDHLEFKLRLDKEKDVDLAEIQVKADIAASQATIIAAALKSANIDIVGGETTFFDKIVGATSQGKALDRLVDNSKVLTDVKDTFFTGNPDDFRKNVRGFVQKFGITTQELKDLSMSALLLKMSGLSKDEATTSLLNQAKVFVQESGLADIPATMLNRL